VLGGDASQPGLQFAIAVLALSDSAHTTLQRCYSKNRPTNKKAR
jgi:hypothetical protein